ncbi:MAG: iron ABC transporter permease [Candidatus Omnitrophica bacterium]|nr:iron ABC transporter permease [Candidatus Omnitrophota bacterium]
MNRIKPATYILFSLLFIIALVILCMLIGPVRIAVDEIFLQKYSDIMRLRLFRVILAIAAGAGLSLSGVILQGVLRNPLSEPYVLGVSSGSGLGAVIGLLFFSHVAAASHCLAFLGGILTIIIVYNIARSGNRLSTENMIISGILVSALFSSLLMFFVSISSSAKVHSVMWWLLGNLQVYKGIHVGIVSSAVVMGLLLAALFAKELNALSLGEEDAMHLGVDINKVKKLLLVISALVTSIVVSMCGIIGFVGLMVPHITRRLVGPDHRALIPASVLTGAAFLLVCDLFSRTVMAPAEIPVGVVTAFIGVPFFMFILRKSRKAYFN